VRVGGGFRAGGGGWGWGWGWIVEKGIGFRDERAYAWLGLEAES